MHAVGAKVQEVLREMFPESNINVREWHRQHKLGASFVHNGQRLLIVTPETTDYRAFGYQIWVHRFAELIRKKIGVPS